KPRSVGSSLKFHVVETFTGTWCPPCANADPALSRLTEEYKSNAVFLFWHCCTDVPTSGNFDPYWTASTYNTRKNFYVPGIFGIPTVIFDGGGEYADGTLVDVGTGPPNYNTVDTYNMYRLDLEDMVDTSSNIAVTVNADMTATQISVTTSIYASDPVTQTNLYVRTIVYEDALYYMGTNSAPYHRNVARALNEQVLMTIPTVGQTVTVSTSFTIPPGGVWNFNKLGVAALVQSNTKRTVTSGGYSFTISDILNADKQDLVPRGILLHMDQGTTAVYTEIYEKLLSQANEHFDTWNVHVLGTDTGSVDDRQVPDAATLAETPLVVWQTGTQTTNTLTATERGALGPFLDASGNLLLTGNGIGFEGWTQFRTWFQQYLHATYESDDTGATYVNGAAGDPIGDPFSGVNLNILGSPDRINMVVGPNNGVPFNYPGPLPAGVRATHDADSRVVYLGFLYFENTADINRMAVMTKVIDWMDGASPPKVDVLYPDGGEQINPMANVDIRWHASDVRIPVDGVDIYFNDNYPAGTWQTVAQNQPNDGLYKWTLPSVNSGSCRIRVVVRDSSPETIADGIGESASDFICGNPYFELQFTSADVGTKRLISYPMIVTDTSVTTVLSSLSGSYGVVRWYDPNDAADHWKAWYPTKGNGDLQYLDNTVGFWIEITAPGTLRIMGDRPASPQIIALKAGWNLVGFPSYNTAYTVAMLKTDTGATRVEGYLASASPYYLQVLSGATTLATGDGYWVYVPADAIWTVPL
ncbi:MAG: thioredoxin family protein, partial [Candidatus Thermoplasmatota archaeon]